MHPVNPSLLSYGAVSEGAVMRVSQTRAGKLLWTGDVRLWPRANGGSAGDLHGRREKGFASAQWAPGDGVVWPHGVVWPQPPAATCTNRGARVEELEKTSGERLSGERLSGERVSGERLSGERISGERLSCGGAVQERGEREGGEELEPVRETA